MIEENDTKLDGVIDQFLVDTPNPSVEDWKRLIDANPDHANSIAEIALAYADNVRAKDSVSDQAGDPLYIATISSVLNLVHQTPSSVLERAAQKVNGVKGPATRTLAVEIGIGPYPTLLNGILVGRTLAPRQILEALENKLEVPIAALAAYFRQSFEEAELPAFKATNGQPVLSISPTAWNEAVQQLHLSTQESERLMRLDEDEDADL